MTESKMTGWQRALVWIAGISLGLVVTGYATFEQWSGFALGLLGMGGR